MEIRETFLLGFPACLATFFTLVGAPALASDSETAASVCDDAAREIVELVDVESSDALAGRFSEDLSGPDGHFTTVLGVVLREFGHPTETKRDDSIDPKDFTQLGLHADGPKDGLESYVFRTVFHLEGDGVIVLRLSPVDPKCAINSLIFGLPRSRSDAFRRHYETTTRIQEALADFYE